MFFKPKYRELYIMFNLKKLFFVLKAPVVVVKEEQNVEKFIERTIVSKFARGNVSLQAGRYITRQEIDARYEKIKQHSFV